MRKAIYNKVVEGLIECERIILSPPPVLSYILPITHPRGVIKKVRLGLMFSNDEINQ